MPNRKFTAPKGRQEEENDSATIVRLPALPPCIQCKGSNPIDLRPPPILYVEYIAGILRARGRYLLAAGGMPNHVHLLVDLSKQVSVSSSLRDFKSNSSGWIHRTFSGAENFQWQAGYAAFGVSSSDLAEVKQYISRQVDHHRSVSFQEEFLARLKEHEFEYDERYLWD